MLKVSDVKAVSMSCEVRACEGERPVMRACCRSVRWRQCEGLARCARVDVLVIS